MKNPFRKVIIEKPQFNNIPKVKIGIDSHCYLLPTGNGFSKSMAEHKWQSGYGSDVYKCQFYMITYAYTIFFLWFRFHIEFKQRSEGMGNQLVQVFKPTDKSKTTIEDILK